MWRPIGTPHTRAGGGTRRCSTSARSQSSASLRDHRLRGRRRFQRGSGIRLQSRRSSSRCARVNRVINSRPQGRSDTRTRLWSSGSTSLATSPRATERSTKPKALWGASISSSATWPTDSHPWPDPRMASRSCCCMGVSPSRRAAPSLKRKKPRRALRKWAWATKVSSGTSSAGDDAVSTSFAFAVQAGALADPSAGVTPAGGRASGPWPHCEIHSVTTHPLRQVALQEAASPPRPPPAAPAPRSCRTVWALARSNPG